MDSTHAILSFDADFVGLPVWMWLVGVIILLVGIIPPAILTLIEFRRNHREMNHLCLHCGYDLRRSKDRCPECGMPIGKNEAGFGTKNEPGREE